MDNSKFEAYFKRADLDGDGKISGAEAVAFFQGSNLSKQVLAQIWMHADQSHTGFLNRQEFYNALKLVTVAQSKRDLTPDIVKAALYGPASAKIPPPQISLPATPAPSQFSSMGSSPAPQVGAAVTQTPSQNLASRPQGGPSPAVNQSYFAQQNQSPRPPQQLHATAPRPPQSTTTSLGFSAGGVMGMPSAASTPSSNVSSDWLSGKTPRPIHPTSSSSISNDSKAMVASGNGSAPDSVFGGDMFSAFSATQPKQPTLPNYSASTPVSSAIVPVSSAAPASAKPSSPLDSLQSSFSLQNTGAQPQQAQASLTRSIQAQGSSSYGPSGIPVGVGNSASDSSQTPWPKMKPTDVQKYTKVFMEVDSDRDGKITGEQARNLFLSWRLPIDVLKQVWDLSDQDNDSMLSLREFCFALYLMERYREGRPLPATLPSSMIYDETLLSMTGQPRAAYGNAAWSHNGGYAQQQKGIHSNQPAVSAPGLRPPTEISPREAVVAAHSNQQKLGAPVLDDSFLNQQENGDKTSANAKSEGAALVKKAAEAEKVILDSREKMEYYRTMMQELVLYKSRCDNRLNEITERALADKREAETLAKKYEEKYKQVAELASKLTIEEATFREIQERKTELHQAIVRVEQGGSADGILQVRADRIQSHLEELVKGLNERCKKHGLEMKSTAVIELPPGWQPGIQEGSAIWDEEWDKFEDQGFGNEVTVDGKVVSIAPNPKYADVAEDGSANDSQSPGSSFYTDGKPENGRGDESVYAHSEYEFERSPHDSPTGRTVLESPSRESSHLHFDKNANVDAETHGSFDEPAWGAFDNDDVDSVWGFNPGKDYDKQEDFFGGGDFGVNPIRTGSPGRDDFYQKKNASFEDSVPSTPMSRGTDSFFQRKSPIFEDSVPSTPMSKFGASPRYSDADQFDKFSRFDSFSMQDGGFSQPDKLTRFDSINSTKDFGRGFSRFDSMSSAGDFGNNSGFSRFDSMSSSRDFGQSHQLSRFDSMNSSKDFGGQGYSFDDADPFGSNGPFKASSDNQSPKKNSDNWRSF